MIRAANIRKFIVSSLILTSAQKALPFFFRFLPLFYCDQSPLQIIILDLKLFIIKLNSNRKMKKQQYVAYRLSSPNSKLIKKKRKLITQSSNQKQNEQYKLTVDIQKCGTKNTLVLKFQPDAKLSLVKLAIYEKLKSLKINTEGIIGFETCNQNFAFDYKFQLGLGTLKEDLKLKYFYSSYDKGLQKYKICCCLAIGGFSKVFLVRSKQNGNFFAAKFIDKSKKQLLNQSLLEMQKKISLLIDSPFLVKTHEFIETDQFLVFIMDYCPGGELFYLLKQIKCMNQQQARICFIQILLGIEYLHNSGYMYRDLKPQNILLDAFGYLKIADFGLSKPYHQKSYSFCGSVEYMAPQIIRGRGHTNYVDFYCLGALLFEMLVGHPPFYDLRFTQQQTKTRILFDDIKFPKSVQLSTQARDLILKLTHKNQKERLGYFGGCRQIIAHPWVGKMNRKFYQQKLFKSPFPVNLDQLNFDPEQIGQSERIFQQRINQAISTISKTNFRRERKQKSLSNFEHKKKSRSQKYVSNNFKSPYKNQSISVYSLLKERQKSPYEAILNASKSSKIIKTQKMEQKKSQSSNKKYMYNMRWTQSQSQKQNKNLVSKLRKKGRYIPFHTITQNNISPSKNNNLEKQKSLIKVKDLLSPKKKSSQYFIKV